MSFSYRLALRSPFPACMRAFELIKTAHVIIRLFASPHRMRTGNTGRQRDKNEPLSRKEERLENETIYI